MAAAEPYLRAMGKRVHYCGGPGSGQAAKVLPRPVAGGGVPSRVLPRAAAGGRAPAHLRDAGPCGARATGAPGQASMARPWSGLLQAPEQALHCPQLRPACVHRVAATWH